MTAAKRQAKARPGPVSAAEARARTAFIINVATEEFLECGFEGATLARIAKRARVSKTTLYALFESKEALFSHVVVASIANSKTDIEKALDSHRPFKEVIRDVVSAISLSVAESSSSRVLRLVLAESARFPALAHVTRTRAAIVTAPLSTYLRKAVPELSIADADVLVRHLTTMATGSYGSLLGMPSRLFGDRAEWIDTVTDIFIAAFPKARSRIA